MFRLFKNKTVIALEKYHQFTGMQLPAGGKNYSPLLIGNFTKNLCTIIETKCRPESPEKVRSLAAIAYIYSEMLVEKTGSSKSDIFLPCLTTAMMHLADIQLRPAKEQLIARGWEEYSEMLAHCAGLLGVHARQDAASIKTDNTELRDSLLEALDIILFEGTDAKYRAIAALCRLVNSVK